VSSQYQEDWAQVCGCACHIGRFQHQFPRLLETIRRTTAPQDVGPNDTEARISVEEVPPVNPFPSHLLVIEQHPPIRGQRHRTFIPVHDVVILSFMARVNLPPRLDPKPLQKGDKIEITVPIARLAIPNPRTFDRIMSYMYCAYKLPDILTFFDQHMGYAGLPEAARTEAASSLPRLLRVPFLNPDTQLQWMEWSRQVEGRTAAQVSSPVPRSSLAHHSIAFYDILLREAYRYDEGCQYAV